MGASQTVTLFYAGAAAATGDTYLTFTQTLTEVLPTPPLPRRSIYRSTWPTEEDRMAAYSVVMQNQTIAGASTLVFIRAAAAASSRASYIRILRAWCSQEASETSQQLGVALGQKVTAFGTYTSTAPVGHAIGSVGSAIAGGTSGAAATSGTDASAEGAGAFTPIIEDRLQQPQRLALDTDAGGVHPAHSRQRHRPQARSPRRPCSTTGPRA